MSSKNQAVLHPKPEAPSKIVRNAKENGRNVLSFVRKAEAGMKVLVCYPDEAGRIITFVDTLAEPRWVDGIRVYLPLMEKPRTDTDYGGVFSDEIFAISEVRRSARDERTHDPDGTRYLEILEQYALP
ncbi:MAG: hypothetical protein NUV60_03350 [Patescibacteria group bacterium]|nr:hypothetical protein [Patescibacteria group bacterium]